MTNYDDAFSTRPFTLRLIVTLNSQNIAANTSSIHWVLRVIRTGNYESFSTSGNSYSVILNGSTADSGSWTYDFRGTDIGDYENIDSGDRTITHNADGTKSISVSASATGSSIGSASKSGTYTLPTIPRASVPTFDQSGVPVTAVNAGDSVDINMNRASSSFTHTVEYIFGSQSGTIGTGVTTDTTWTPPVTLLTEIPNSTSGAVQILTTTFNGATQIGQSSVVMTLVAGPTAVPDFGTVTATEATTSPNVASIVGAFVKNLSTLAVAITSPVGYQGSTIVSQKIEVINPSSAVTQTISAGSGTTAVISWNGTGTLRGTVTDSRGQTHSEDVTLTVMNYAVPVITTATAVRANSGGTVTPSGTYIRVDIVAAVQSLVVGTQKNNLTYTIKTKPTSGSYNTVDGPTSAGATSYSNYRTVGTYSIANSYVVRLEITDALGSVSFVELTVGTGGALMHFSKTNDGIGVGKYWQQGSVDAALRMYQQNGLKVIDEGDVATLTARGVVELATTAEAITGTDADRAVTPAGLKAATDSVEANKTGYRYVQTVPFTSSGTFSKGSYAWLKAIVVECQGGGGAGGGRSSSFDASAGGGGGGTAKSFITDIAGLASSVTVTVGAGGTGVSNGDGNDGGSSSFGALVIGAGGTGGIRGDGNYGAAGGTGTGDIVFPGWPGGTARSGVNAGAGGSSRYGQGGRARSSGVGSGVGSTGTGYGGGGAGSYGTTTGPGGAGSAGVVYVELYA